MTTSHHLCCRFLLQVSLFLLLLTAALTPSFCFAASGLNAGDLEKPDLQYFAVRQAATGDCVVAVGVEGIAPGDKVFGTFTSFEEAQKALERSCREPEEKISIQKTIKPAAPPKTPPPTEQAGSALSAEQLYKPHKKVTKGKWGHVARILEVRNFDRKKTEAGLLVEDGYFVSPGDQGPTEIIYLHDGSRLTLKGVTTVLDCLDYCGRAGSMNFVVKGDNTTLWESGLILQSGQPLSFSVDLSGVNEIRLIAEDGGNGNGEDWGGWLNLSVAPVSGTTLTKPSTPTVITASTAIESAAFATPILAIPKYDDDESTKGIFFINLDTGNAFFIDRVKSSPLSVRTRSLNRNAFKAVGRTPGRAAGLGEVLVGEIRSSDDNVTALLLVDTTSGKMGYITDLKTHSYDGRLRAISSRPAESISSPDGNYALIMRRGSSGRTKGCYLYHATSGNTIYIPHIHELKSNLSPVAATPLPKMEGRVSALGLQSSSEATTGILLIDNGSGNIYHVGEVERYSDRLSVQQDKLNLFSTFPRNSSVPTPKRFVLVPIYSRSGETESVFILDTGSGESAILKYVHSPGRMRLVKTTRNVYDWFPRDLNRPRIMTAVPKVRSNGATEGIWIFDSTTGNILYFENLSNPRKIVVYRVQQKTR